MDPEGAALDRKQEKQIFRDPYPSRLSFVQPDAAGKSAYDLGDRADPLRSFGDERWRFGKRGSCPPFYRKGCNNTARGNGLDIHRKFRHTMRR
jgi:hypothetical protein